MRDRRIFNLLLFIAAFLIVALLTLRVAGAAAGEINIQLDFAYNGGEDTDGFTLYREDPAGVESRIVQISGGGVRTWSGTISVEPGRSLYYMTAYGADWESARSNIYPFEYIEASTPGTPPPTIIIKFN